MTSKPAVIILNKSCMMKHVRPDAQAAELRRGFQDDSQAQRWLEQVLVKYILRDLSFCVPVDSVTEIRDVTDLLLPSTLPLVLWKQPFTDAQRVIEITVRTKPVYPDPTEPNTVEISYDYEFNVYEHDPELQFYLKCVAEKRPVELYVFTNMQPFHDLVNYVRMSNLFIPRDVTRLSVPQAVILMQRWHMQIETTMDEMRADIRSRGPGKRKLLHTVEGWRFEQLLDYQAFAYEGSIQHHCVETFWPQPFDNTPIPIIISAYHEQGDLRYTIEIWQLPDTQEPHLIEIRVAQIRGLQNAEPSPVLFNYLGNHARYLTVQRIEPPTYAHKYVTVGTMNYNNEVSVCQP